MDTHFTPEAVRERLIDIPGARNFRDMGGYPAADGRKVKRGVLYRSGHPGEIAAEHLPRLLELGLRTIVDLRTTGEREATPFAQDLRDSLQYWTRDYSFSRGDLITLLKDPSIKAEAVATRMAETYRTLPAEQSAAVGALFERLLAQQAPLLICCSAGKDRTGVLSALILSALGVPREAVLRDYALTEQLHPPKQRLFKQDPHSPLAHLLDVQPEILLPVMSSPRAYLEAMFEGLEERHGGVEPFLADAHGIDETALDQLRAAYLED